jgi:hypothetical protein
MEPNGGLIGNASTSVTNLQKDFLHLGNIIENTVLPKINSLVSALNDASEKAANILGGTGSSTAGGSSKFKVAPNGVTQSGGGGSRGEMAGGMAGGMAAAYGLQAIRAASNALPGTNTAVMQDFLTQRSAFFGQGGYTGSLQSQTGNVRALQNMMARVGIANNSMDTTNALAALQPLGYANNFGSVAKGVAEISNYTPGLGQTAIAQAVTGTMNAPNTINLAKTIGINIRDAQGNIMPVDKLADQIWNYITRFQGKKPSKREVQISLAPGNGLYGMLMGLFSNDPTMFTIISNALIAKAQYGGEALSDISKTQLKAAGIQSSTIQAMANQTAYQTGLLTSTASAQAGGYAGAADIGAGMNNLAIKMSDLTAVLSGGKGLLGGLGGLGNGSLGSIAKLGAGFAAKSALKAGGKIAAGSVLGEILPFLLAGFLADGGPADAKQPYIVGEVGPELFVPKTDGYVIPNNVLNNMHRDMGGDVKAFESNFFKDISAPNTPTNRNILEQWMRYESGNNPMRFNNPLNSTLRMKGSVSENKVGVQKYLNIAQGSQADAATLLNTKGEGYDKILAAFRSGKSADQIWSSIVESGWVTGKVDPKRTQYSPGSGGSGSSGGSTAVSSSGKIVTALPFSTTADSQRQSLSALLASAFGGSSVAPAGNTTSQTTYNYGGVSVTIQADKNPQATVDAMQKALKNKTTVTTVGVK